jgi:hypothetical protein
MKIKREDMPQTKSADKFDVLSELQKYAEVNLESTKVSELKPIQSDVSKEKIVKMFSNIKEKKSVVPIFISEDNFIIDGHHRWLACELAFGNETEMPTWKIKLPAKEALECYSKVAEKIK